MPSSSCASQCICFGNVRSRSTFAEHVRQHVDGRAAANAPLDTTGTCRAACRPAASASKSTPSLRAKPRPGVRRMAFGVERRADRRPHHRLVAVLLPIDQLGQARREPARRRVRFDARARRGESLLRSAAPRAAPPAARSAPAATTPASPRRRFRAAAHDPCAARLFCRRTLTQALAIATASCRTRRM